MLWLLCAEPGASEADEDPPPGSFLARQVELLAEGPFGGAPELVRVKAAELIAGKSSRQAVAGVLTDLRKREMIESVEIEEDDSLGWFFAPGCFAAACELLTADGWPLPEQT